MLTHERVIQFNLSKEGPRNALRILSKVDAKFSRLKIEDLVDDRIARKLENERN